MSAAQNNDQSLDYRRRHSYDPAVHHRRSIRLPGYDYTQAGAYFITICTQNRHRLFGNIVGGEMGLNDAGIMVADVYAELENKFPDIQCDAFVCMPNHVHFVVINVGENTVGAVRVGMDIVGANLRVRPLLPTEPAPPATPQPSGESQTPGEPGGAGMGENVPGIDERAPGVGDNAPGQGERVHPDGQGERMLGVGERTLGVGERTLGVGERTLGVGERTLGVGERTLVDEGEHAGSPLRSVIRWFKTMTTNRYIRGVKHRGWRRFDGKLWQRNYWEHIVRNEPELNRIRTYIINNPAQWESDKMFGHPMDRSTEIREPATAYMMENWQV